MQQSIYKFFAFCHHVSMPGIGSFYADDKDAEIDFSSKKIHPPLTEIRFIADKKSTDKNLFSYLANEENISEVEAVDRYSLFINQQKKILDYNGFVLFDGIGKIQKQDADTFIFHPEKLPDYLPLIDAQKIVRKNASHVVLVGENERTSEQMQSSLTAATDTVKKENWWLAAVIFAVIGIAAIAFYYLLLHPINTN